jgi:hypothetical protein
LLQHDLASGLLAIASAWATCSAGSAIPRAWAQAIRSAGVWQQQFVQHRSASWQPQGLFMQGNGRDTSFSTTAGSGSGTPPATSR